MADVSICICTFRRPEGLLRLLRSLLHLDPSTPSFEVIVVDNDAARTGEAAARQARAEGLQALYLIEPVRGIARARNRAVAQATGEFVAFIDDDEEADPQWLARLHGEVLRHDNDGGIGPVLPRFAAGTPPFLIEGRFFERGRPPTGTMLSAAQTRARNALIRRRHLLDLDGPFNTHFDLTGGEDTDLFARLIARDARVIAVDSAIVYEHLTLARANVRWLLWRRFLLGASAARRYLATVPENARPRRQRARPLASGILWGLGGVLLFPFFRIRGLDCLTHAARHLGRFSFHAGFSFHPYARDSWR